MTSGMVVATCRSVTISIDIFMVCRGHQVLDSKTLVGSNRGIAIR